MLFANQNAVVRSCGFHGANVDWEYVHRYDSVRNTLEGHIADRLVANTELSPVTRTDLVLFHAIVPDCVSHCRLLSVLPRHVVVRQEMILDLRILHFRMLDAEQQHVAADDENENDYDADADDVDGVKVTMMLIYCWHYPCRRYPHYRG